MNTSLRLLQTNLHLMNVATQNAQRSARRKYPGSSGGGAGCADPCYGGYVTVYSIGEGGSTISLQPGLSTAVISGDTVIYGGGGAGSAPVKREIQGPPKPLPPPPVPWYERRVPIEWIVIAICVLILIAWRSKSEFWP